LRSIGNIRMTENDIVVGANRYGKANVHFLRLFRDSVRHEVKELRCRLLLEGDFKESYSKGSNALVIPTDTQKNTLFALSKKYQMDPIEEWAISVAKDIFSRHLHVEVVNLDIEELPWSRVIINGEPHNHAFQKLDSGIRFCDMRFARNGTLNMSCGFKDLQVMKTTKSGFEGYIKDQYTTLQETNDRILCTKINITWSFFNLSISNVNTFRFNYIHDRIKEIALELFCGDPKHGFYSPSVQGTMYEIGKKVLQTFPELEKIHLLLPNIHYFLVDFRNFKGDLRNNNEVFQTFDGPFGNIEATFERSQLQPRPRL